MNYWKEVHGTNEFVLPTTYTNSIWVFKASERRHNLLAVRIKPAGTLRHINKWQAPWLVAEPRKDWWVLMTSLPSPLALLLKISQNQYNPRKNSACSLCNNNNSYNILRTFTEVWVCIRCCLECFLCIK